MSLESKHVLVFAATGAIGSGVARELAGQGARVWLSGRRAGALKELAAELSDAGGKVETDVVDATHPRRVADYVERVAVRTNGRIDGVFNAIGLPPAELGYPARSPELDFDTFMRPQRIILGSTFLTARSAGAHMLRQGSGSIVTLSASLSGTTIPWMAALTATCGAIAATVAFLISDGASGMTSQVLNVSGNALV